MKTKTITIAIFAVVLLGGFAALNFSTGRAMPTVSASELRGNLHIVKTCPQYVEAHGAAGSHCTITASDVPQIPVGTVVYYDQTAGAPLGSGVPAGFIDSNALVYVAPGDWAVGRCTVDESSFTGLCTFSNGVGALAGFRARIDVSPAGGVDFNWDGRYNFGGE
ncbi:MAG: hypothetical protein JOZ44_19325 [Acidobacteria bacterium]|nr:hypothetical protein [Acidobacteriota bacterium]